jgi:general secretion pathway protein G
MNFLIHRFTLLERVIIGMILAVVAGAVVYFFIRSDAERWKCNLSEAHSIKESLDDYRLLTGAYPTERQGLSVLTEKPPVRVRHRAVLSEIPRDRWERAYVYRNPGRRDTKGVDVFSMGPDGVADTADDVYAD